ncbi:hypothetical protein BUALT_Bualt03G0078600 [Buddleja alternifolia]|uniref:F-box protein n=1 Tax=Buddleja alternifolia TaxID=168488 RepID=A0AAV6XTG6_9LAMI|nr:hypothetical protein BUALT_Bualt03G0078600 [Buddleja alternifolia]
MHTNVGEQRENWNSLLLNSINMITFTATTMAGLTAAGVAAQPVLTLKLSSAALFAAATGLLMVMNKLQPSQLVEEQRNATTLFKQLQEEILTILAVHEFVITEMDVDYMIELERVLPLDKAYPLPLIEVMLEKFPAKLEPSVWWFLNQFQQKGMATVGSVFSGSSSLGILATAIAVGGGALSTVVNSIEHGGQVGMVFEMYRNCAGFYRLLEESIKSSIGEREVNRRGNGGLMEMKVALQLGRSLTELKDLAMALASSRKDGQAIDEFASKLF